VKQGSTRDDDDFIERQGPAFLAHLLRRLSDDLVEGDKLWHAELGVSTPPKTTSTMLALDERGSLSVTELAALLRQSHPLVIQWIKALSAEGLVETVRDREDRRRSLVSLTAKGRAEMPKLRRAIDDVAGAVRSLMGDVQPGVYEALWQIERMNRTHPFIDRIRDAAGRKA
jgi:DNA-binding MarR family transcriptional regulator